MPGIEIKGRSKIANYRHGGRTEKFGGGRTNLLEQLGRVEAEPSNPNRRAEISRVHGELNRGYKDGGRIKAQSGKFITKKDKEKTQWITKKPKYITRKEEPKAYITRKEEPKAWITKKDFKTHGRDVPTMAAKGGRIGLRHGTPHHENVTKWISRPGKRKKMGKRPRAGGPRIINPKWGETNIPSRLDSQRKNIRLKAEHAAGLKKGGKVDKKWIQKAVNPKHKGYCTPMTKKTCTPARKALARTFKKKAKTGW